MNIVRCKKAFYARVDGRQRAVRVGELFSADHPVAKQNSGYFEAAEAVAVKQESRPVERATAEPGEKRSVGRPRKTAKAELTPENAPKTAAEAEAAGVTLDEAK